MKKIYSVALFFVLGLFMSCAINAQSPTQLRKKCPNTSVYSDVSITSVGDVTVNPCPSRATIFTQNVTLPSSTVITGSGMTGNPNLAFTATNITSTTTGSQNFRGQTYNFSNNAGTAEFQLSILPSSTIGAASLGDCVTTPTACVQLAQSSNSSFINGNLTEIGNSIGAGNGHKLSINDSTGVFTFASTANAGVFNLAAVNNYQMQRTITAGGTTGAQVINKPNGTVNFAAAATTLVVTNSIATTTSTIFANAYTNDATCSVKDVERANGSFTIRMTAACTAETAVGFIVFN